MNIVFCLPGRSFSGEFIQAWTQLSGACLKNNINVILSQRYNSNVYYVRAQCLGADVRRGRHQIPFDGKVNYDYIMWIDSDIIFQVQDFFTLLKHGDKDIVSGLYLMDGGKEYTVVRNWDLDYFSKRGMFQFLKPEDEVVKRGELFTAEYSGLGFMLVKKGVFEKVEYPWFEPQFTQFGGDVYDFCSEDVGFCRKATAAGFQIWIDPTVKVLHEKMTVY